MEHTFDVAIIGAGIGGATLGAILARQGVRVVIFEAKSHPRFAIGESMILETSEIMRALAEMYDVPEIAHFSSENYLDYAGSTHGVKRHFGFLHHTAGMPHDPARTVQAVIPREPHGHELHLYRQDVDYYLTVAAVHYGATVLQNTRVTAIDFAADGVTLLAAASGQEPTVFSAAYVVDAAGFGSPLARQFDLRRHDLRTHSRAIFTHMIDVPEVSGPSGNETAYDDLPFPMSEGTLHHVFDGGWLWVIPFNNHAQSTNPLCSVGLLLDPRVHPAVDGLSAAAEFWSHVNRFPTIAAQLRDARTVRPWTRTPRLQYRSRQVVGDRWALLGHAAGFIDPLYSKGLYLALAGVSVLAERLLAAQRTGDYSAATFAPVERLTQAFIESADRLVANSYKSWADPRLWQVYSVLWLLGAYTEYVKLNAIRAIAGADRDAYYASLHALRLAGGGFDGFFAAADAIDTVVDRVDVRDPAAVGRAVAEIRNIFAGIEWMPQPFNALLDGRRHLPRTKLRLSLLRPARGFMGRGAYRHHFFGAHSLLELARVYLAEKIRYSRYWLRRRR